jgi:hypothetical protein
MSLIKNKLSLNLPKQIKRIIVPKLAFLNTFKLLGKSCLSCLDGRVHMCPWTSCDAVAHVLAKLVNS